MMLVSAATLAQGQSANLPRYEFFAGYSVNADYIRNRLFLLALDQKALREICGRPPRVFWFLCRVPNSTYSRLDLSWDISTQSDSQTQR
jgi:hypothetical protein